MPSIQTSLLMPMPAGVGQMPCGLCREGARVHRREGGGERDHRCRRDPPPGWADTTF